MIISISKSEKITSFQNIINIEAKWWILTTEWMSCHV